MKKYLKLINPKVWLDNLIVRTMVNKAIKHAATALAGVVTGLAVKHKLTDHGVALDVPAVTESLIVLFTGLYGWVVNWAKDAANEKKSDPTASPETKAA